jgi:hypothetical protein
MNDAERKAAAFAFRCPNYLHAAMAAAAKADCISVSDVARLSIIKVLSERGIIAKNDEHRAA